MKSGVIRIVFVLTSALAAFALGRWSAGTAVIADPESTVVEAPPTVVAPPVESPAAQSAPPPPPRAEVLRAELEELADAARTMATPDARTYGFFEKLTTEDMSGVVELIENLPAGNEQDALYLLAMKRWAQLDPRTALRRSNEFPALGTRMETRATIFQEWSTQDAATALLRAADEADEGAQRRAVSAVLVGAATVDPSNAFSLLDLAPVAFLNSPAVPSTIERMVQAGYGTGQRQALQAVIERMRPSDTRTLMIDILARNWSAHFPDEAYAWVRELLPAGETQDKVVQNLFTALAFKDPSRAAQWVVQELPEPMRTKYLAAAISQWAQFDLRGVEIWLNEQPSGLSVDGGSLALASHFMKEGHLSRAFSWIRRINQDAMRTKMFGDLGKLWSQERPEEFQRFLNESSLNRAEVELLTAEIKPRS